MNSINFIKYTYNVKMFPASESEVSRVVSFAVTIIVMKWTIADPENSSLLLSSATIESFPVGDQMSVSSSYVCIFAYPAPRKRLRSRNYLQTIVHTIQEIANTQHVLRATRSPHQPNKFENPSWIFSWIFSKQFASGISVSEMWLEVHK